MKRQNKKIYFDIKKQNETTTFAKFCSISKRRQARTTINEYIVTQPTCSVAPMSMYKQDVTMRTPMQMIPQPQQSLNSLPLKEVNSKKETHNVRGIGTRYDRTSVKCPLYGPLSPMVQFGDARYNKGNYTTSKKEMVVTTY